MSTEFKYDNRRKSNSYNKYSKGKKNYGGSSYKPSQGKGASESFKGGTFKGGNKNFKYSKNYRKKPYQKQFKPIKNKPSVKIAFLGGLNEIGKNITMIECENDIILVDCGMAFLTEICSVLTLLSLILLISNRIKTKSEVLCLLTVTKTTSADFRSYLAE